MSRNVQTQRSQSEMKRRNKSSFGDSLGAATMRQSVPGRGQIIKLEQKAKMWNRFDKMQPSLLYVCPQLCRK